MPHVNATKRSALRLLCGLSLAVVSLSAGAADERFDRSQYGGKGGFTPVTNDVYAKECGSCHFAYLPGFLPARSWRAIIGQSGNHFGESLDLSPEVRSTLVGYLEANAADKSDDRGSEMLLHRLPESSTPMRVTAVPIIHRNHVIVREVIKINSSVKARTITNCNSCHTAAEKGSFAFKELIVPGLTKVITPNSQF